MRGPAKVAVFLVLAISCVPTLLSSTAFAHGDAPSTCENRYDAGIASMVIDNGTQTFDPVSDSDLEFAAQIGAGYDVMFILHTANASSQNNTLAGNTWYRSTAFGFGSGVCVDDAGPDKDIQLTVHVEVMPGVPDGYAQNGVEWGSWPDGSQVRYNVVWHNASESESSEEGQPTEEEQPQQDNQTDSEQPLPPAENDDKPESGDKSEEDLEESEDGYSTGALLSPFVFKDESTAVSATVKDDIEEPLPHAADALYINGTLASYHYLASQLHVLSGNWSMTMNDTAVFDFDANFTMVRSDGLERRAHSLANLTAVNDSDLLLGDATMALTSELDFANGTTTRVNATITVIKLDVIHVELSSLDTPVYGVVDKVVRTENGETMVMARQLDMI